jgi:hypothetical protein
MVTPYASGRSTGVFMGFVKILASGLGSSHGGGVPLLRSSLCTSRFFCWVLPTPRGGRGININERINNHVSVFKTPFRH